MTPQRFFIGQEVTPKYNNGGWWSINNGRNIPPKFGEIYHVKQYHFIFRGVWCMELCEIDGIAYSEQGFSPVLPAEALQELMEMEVMV